MISILGVCDVSDVLIKRCVMSVLCDVNDVLSRVCD